MAESNNIEVYVFEELNPDPDDDSRSVHDDVNKIYRKVMGISAPINAKMSVSILTLFLDFS